MKAKAFILNCLFNKRQREIIWNAVLFSEHTYRRRGDVDSAAQVQQVINEVATTFGVKETFTRQEVDEIMKRTGQQVADDIQKVVGEKLQKAYKDGRKAGIKETLDKLTEKFVDDFKPEKIEPLVKGGLIDTKKCEECAHKDECGTLKMIREFEQEEKTDEAEHEDAASDAGDAEDSAEGKSQAENSADAEQAGEHREPGAAAE
jgi:hypothetical protein